MRVIGITGGVGAGKSTVLDYINNNYRAKILMADNIAHDLMEPGMECNRRIAEEFGQDILDESGHIIKEKLAGLIFGDQQKRELVNSIVHPAVKAFILKTIKDERTAEKLDFVIVEAALLLEDNYTAFCDEVWYIFSSEDNRRARLKTSRGYSDEKISSIFNSQMSEEIFRSKCNIVIDNDGGIEGTQTQIKRILDSYGGKKE